MVKPCLGICIVSGLLMMLDTGAASAQQYPVKPYAC